MGSKWKRVTVADVCTSIVDCVNKTAPVVEYPTNYKMIRTPNIRSGKVTLDGCRYVEKEVYETWTRRSKPQKEDVLLTREAPLGEVGIITTDENIFLGQRIMQYRADKNKIYPYFLLYSFLSPDLQQQFSMHEGSGSVVSHIRVGDCSKFEINIPPLEVQRSIVEVLKSIDDHIDVNIKINQTLEQMSQTLFKSWFVDFDPVIDNALDAGKSIPEALQSRAELRQKVRNSADFKPLPADIRALFPAEFEETELGCIPKGWNINNVGRLSENIFSGGTPNTNTEEYWNGTLNWFSSGETRNSIIIETEKKITEAGVKNSSTRLSVSGDILIASAGQGHTRGQTSLNTIDTYINQSVVCIRPMKSSYSSWLYFNISSRYEEMRAISDSHSIRGSLTTKLIASMKVISPNDNLISLFDTSCSTFIRKMRNNLQLSCELKKLRDTLLPKLISGELSLEELPDLIKQTEPT
ncbi:TPA: restriction endonuclease subunit S [Enterobacter bugandensis]|uniref:restriction endonuclease subunit S n=1 Tax=Enterobacter bugandensis TaxID=881260 RepID=UPI002A816820|nr:restriction endonuclease subunit S [Enterobacter bugandensis]HDR2594071.1 restriction endonuclease subunit S [Enterobacter bugandensis]